MGNNEQRAAGSRTLLDIVTVYLDLCLTDGAVDSNEGWEQDSDSDTEACPTAFGNPILTTLSSQRQWCKRGIVPFRRILLING